MKALLIKKYGKLANSLQFEEIASPVVKQDDVLIDIHAASINPIDYKTVQGMLRMVIPMSLPSQIGYDVSGVIIAKGENVNGFDIGDEVFSRVGGDRPGTLAEQIAVDVKYLAHKPKNISHAEAASIPLAGLTTWQAFATAKVQKGSRVLIHAGSGGVGTFAIQLAKAMGAFVYTTTSTKNVDWVKKLGADVVIDYKKEDYNTIVDQVDFVYDTIGGVHVKNGIKLLKNGSHLINLTGPIMDKKAVHDLNLKWPLRLFSSIMRSTISSALKRKNIQYSFFLMKPNGEHLSKIAQYLASGEIKAVIDSVYSFENSIQALEKLATGRAKGKIIITNK